jgi:hypothetical protein
VEVCSGPAAKTVTFPNNTAMGQLLTGLFITWPQATSGNLTQIKIGGTTLTSAGKLPATPRSAYARLFTEDINVGVFYAAQGGQISSAVGGWR